MSFRLVGMMNVTDNDVTGRDLRIAKRYFVPESQQNRELGLKTFIIMTMHGKTC